MEHLPSKSKIKSNTAMLFISMIFIAGFTTCSLQLQAQEGKIVQLMENYDIPDDYKGFTEERFLRSMITDNTFKLYIHLPLTYNTSEISYPILIMTDACFTMGIAETTFDLMSMHKELIQMEMFSGQPMVWLFVQQQGVSSEPKSLLMVRVEQ